MFTKTITFSINWFAIKMGGEVSLCKGRDRGIFTHRSPHTSTVNILLFACVYSLYPIPYTLENKYSFYTFLDIISFISHYFSYDKIWLTWQE